MIFEELTHFSLVARLAIWCRGLDGVSTTPAPYGLKSNVSIFPAHVFTFITTEMGYFHEKRKEKKAYTHVPRLEPVFSCPDPNPSCPPGTRTRLSPTFGEAVLLVHWSIYVNGRIQFYEAQPLPKINLLHVSSSIAAYLGFGNKLFGTRDTGGKVLEVPNTSVSSSLHSFPRSVLGSPLPPLPHIVVRHP